VKNVPFYTFSHGKRVFDILAVLVHSDSL